MNEYLFRLEKKLYLTSYFDWWNVFYNLKKELSVELL